MVTEPMVTGRVGLRGSCTLKWFVESGVWERRSGVDES